MKSRRNILIAFILNLLFSIFEFIGGFVTGSIAITSDAVHDLGDAAGIGLSYFFERKSSRQPDDQFTYGYARYSVLGSAVTTLILLAGSIAIIANAAGKLISPQPVHYDGMILFALVGVCVNTCAALITRDGSSLNQRAVNLHMLEDVLGWIVVLIGAIVMRFTDLPILDPIMSMGVAAFILFNAVKNLKYTVDLLLERAPEHMDSNAVKEHLVHLDGVVDVHDIHIWSMDGQKNYATMHIVSDADPCLVKERVRSVLQTHGIGHVTLELEASGEPCLQEYHHADQQTSVCLHHHHHHHH